MWLEAGGQALFSTCGKVRKITFSEEKDSGKSKGVATVEFAERLPQPPPRSPPAFFLYTAPPSPRPLLPPSCRPPASLPLCRDTWGLWGGLFSSKDKVRAVRNCD